jgi:thioredoxin-dependent peroxiredoxin
MIAPRLGERAPEISAEATDGRVVRLSALRGRWVVVYFFPKAFTPGCRAEARRFRDAYPELRELGAEVIGVSVDDHATQCDFAKSLEVAYPLIGDKSKEISTAFGVVRPLLGFDKRVTFVIDPEGIVRGIFHHEFQISKHLDDVLHLLQNLKKS